MRGEHGPPVRIPIRRDHSVGTKTHPYSARGSDAERHIAIVAGAAHRHAAEGTPVRDALMKIKQRLHAIRIVSKRTEHCEVYERDMRWITRQLGVGGAINPSCEPQKEK